MGKAARPIWTDKPETTITREITSTCYLSSMTIHKSVTGAWNFDQRPPQWWAVRRWEESGGCCLSFSVTLPYMGQRSQAVASLESKHGGQESCCGFTCWEDFAFVLFFTPFRQLSPTTTTVSVSTQVVCVRLLHYRLTVTLKQTRRSQQWQQVWLKKWSGDSCMCVLCQIEYCFHQGLPGQRAGKPSS